MKYLIDTYKLLKNSLILLTKLLTMKKTALILPIFFAFITVNIHAQQATRWLLAELATAQGIRKVEILTTLSQQVEDHIKAQNYASEALTVSKNMDYKDGIAVSYVCLGNLARYILHKVSMNDSLQSLAKQHNTSKESIIKINVLLSDVIFEGQMLKIENEKGLEAAESFYKKALETRVLQDNKDGQIWALKKLGALQEDFQHWEQAEKYYLDWLKVRYSEGDTNKIAWAYTNLAQFYVRNEKKQPDYANKLENALIERFKLKERNLNKEQQVIEFLEIARFYEHWGRIEKAERYYQKALTFFPKKEDNLAAYKALWNDYLDKGKANYEKSRFEAAEENFQKYLKTIYESEFYKKEVNTLPSAYMKLAYYFGYNQNFVSRIQYQCKVLEMRIKENDSKKINWQKVALEDGYRQLQSPQTYRLENQYFTVKKNNQSLNSLFDNWARIQYIQQLNRNLSIQSYEILEAGTKLVIGLDTVWFPKPTLFHYKNAIQSIENVLPAVKDGEIQATLSEILVSFYEKIEDYPKAIVAQQKLLSLRKEANRVIKILVKLGNLYEKQGNAPQAIESYQASATLYEKEKKWSEMANALDLIGQVYQKQKNWQKMLKEYEKIIALLESKKAIINGYDYVQLAIAYKGLNEKEKAIKYTKQALFEKKLEEKFVYSPQNQNSDAGTTNTPITSSVIPVNAFTDNFFSIKEKYGLTDKDIAQLNPSISIDAIAIGSIPMEITELVISGNNSMYKKEIKEKLNPRPYLSEYTKNNANAILKELLIFDEEKDSTFIVHTVGKGETLGSIQRLYGVSESCLNQWNYLGEQMLTEGMKLKVCKKEDWVKNIGNNVQDSQDEIVYHTVNQYIESTYSITRNYSITEQQLNEFNQTQLPYNLERGRRIIVGIKVNNFCTCEDN